MTSFIDEFLKKKEEMKSKTLKDLLKDGALKFHEEGDMKFYEIGDDRYLVYNGKVISNYNLKYEGLGKNE